MDDFDEVCFLCGVAAIGPRRFTLSPNLTAKELANALLEHFPNILDALPTCRTKEDLEVSFEAMFQVPNDLIELTDIFYECIAVGYFDNDGDAPRTKVDNDPVVKFLFPDGQFVKRRWVDEPYCGEFQTVYRITDSDTPGGLGSVDISMSMSRTGASLQGGFGNFFLSRCCFMFLEGWVDRETLPPMWDERQLSFIGELWEIVNSRKTGRRKDGCLEWLEPGGAERKLDQFQSSLAPCGGTIYPVKTAAALQSGYDGNSLLRAIYNDYGYWMFVTPHEWPKAPESEDLVEVTAFGFDVPLRASQTSSFTGSLFRFATEILVLIFSHLPDVTTYLSLKLVSKRMHDLVMDTKFALPVLKEIVRPNPTGEMFWIYPLENQALEKNNFKNSVHPWLALNCTSLEKESATAWDIFSHHEFPLVQFIHALYMSDCSRNRRRLWKNVKKFEEVWIDYRRNGWEVNRFGLPYTESQT